MEQVSVQQAKILPSLIISLVLLFGGLYSGAARSESLPQPPGTQLAWFVGYHNYYGGGYYRPNYVYSPRYRLGNVHWTGWRNYGPRCQRTCLVSNRSGRIVRCKKRCFY